MVNFGKDLQSQLIPEWQQAYCNYAELKGDLKRIKQHRTLGATLTRSGTSLGLLRSIASFKPASLKQSLSRTFTRSTRRPDYMPSSSPRSEQHSSDTIVINKRLMEDGDVYVTDVREPLSRSPQDRTFFARLDAQLTKVNKFYKKKEAENIARAGALEKQMLALIYAQETIARQDLPDYETHLNTLQKGNGAHVADPEEMSGEHPLIRESTDRSDTFLMRPSASGDPGDSDEDDETDDAIQDYIDRVATKNSKMGNAEQTEGAAAGSVLKLRSAMNLSFVTSDKTEREREMALFPGDDDIETQKTYSQKKLDQAKTQLKRAFMEFYRGLSLLSSYRSMNITAFAKIMKKYDKVTGWHLAPIYMKEVESSYFVVSKKIHKLSIKVEDIYTTHFSNGERKKAFAQLRPIRKQGTHRTTFFLGIFLGCTLALFISFFYLVSNPLALKRGGGKAYLDTVFPVFSTLMLVAIHLYLYAFNVYSWQKTRINYPFIFNFSPGTELRYREVLLLSTGFTTFLLGGMNIHIAVTLLTYPDPLPPGEVATSPTAPQSSTVTDVIPLILVVTTLLVLFLPINIMYRSSRSFFLSCFRRLALAPWFKVILSDFFLGDQFTSQVLVFRNLKFVLCYYAGGFFLSQQDQECKSNAVYQGFGYVVALLPYWWRFLQCLRRYHDDKDKHQLQNSGKYMSAIVAVVLRQAYTNYRKWPGYELPLLVLCVIASIVATAYSNYWDLCNDWSLLNKKSKNKWLRDKIILRNKSIYFIAIGTNSILRLAWLATLLEVQSFGFNQNAFDVIMAGLEILRRGIWNFFRIENEHLNNVGGYRAEKAVPLPFNDDM